MISKKTALILFTALIGGPTLAAIVAMIIGLIVASPALFVISLGCVLSAALMLPLAGRLIIDK